MPGRCCFFTNSINIGLSIAAGSLVARELGAGRADQARRHATSVAAIGVLTGLATPVLVLAFLEQILSLLGAEGEVLRLAMRYVWIILPTMWVMALAITGMAVLRAHGDARRSMMATLYGGGLNAVLDPVLIFGLGLGLDGAAIASVLARACMLAAAFWPAVRVHRGFMRPSLRQIYSDIPAIRKIAIPAVLTNIATPVGNAIVLREVGQFGTDAVAGMAVIGRLMPVAFSVIFALSGAIGPIVGQNFGARLFPRVRQAFLAGIAFTGIYTLLVAAVLFALRGPIADLFSADGETRALIYLFCGPLAVMYFFNGVIFVENACFNNLGHPVYSTWINWGRHTLGTWPLAVLGAYLAGAPGVLLGQAFGGVIFAGLGWLLVNRVLSSLTRAEPLDAFAGQNRLHALLGRRGW